ncbi:MAG: Txe/YoeB family addiction module toxin [Prevotellaceae bacterium]|nr:Txe/YoeB family addiction module toxin [Candidatus Minthosoma equi]
MTYSIDTTKTVDKVVSKWKKSNPVLFKKFGEILHELADHPRTGTGHPEPLKGGHSITYSRHITAHNRIIYDIHDDTVTVLVLEVEGHYNDK